MAAEKIQINIDKLELVVNPLTQGLALVLTPEQALAVRDSIDEAVSKILGPESDPE